MLWPCIGYPKCNSQFVYPTARKAHHLNCPIALKLKIGRWINKNPNVNFVGEHKLFYEDDERGCVKLARINTKTYHLKNIKFE